jgi:hypothetical protein
VPAPACSPLTSPSDSSFRSFSLSGRPRRSFSTDYCGRPQQMYFGLQNKVSQHAMVRVTRKSPLTPAGKKTVTEDDDDIEIGSSNMSLKDPVSLMFGFRDSRQSSHTASCHTCASLDRSARQSAPTSSALTPRGGSRATRCTLSGIVHSATRSSASRISSLTGALPRLKREWVWASLIRQVFSRDPQHRPGHL